MDSYFDVLNYMEKIIVAKAVADEEGNRRRLTWRDVALRVYRKDDENAIRATTRLHKRALESIQKQGDT